MSDNLLIIFAKKPELGKNKTRIIQGANPEFALDFSLFCLEDLATNVAGSVKYDTLVTSDKKTDLYFFAKNFNLRGFSLDQIGRAESLDEKFRLTFNHGFKFLKYKKILLIPMDVPYLTKQDIEVFFKKFTKNNVILGPERNGGVYLIGMDDEFKDNLFKNVRWSTPCSFNDLLKNSKKQAYILKRFNDLNNYSDILMNKKIIKKKCPKLFIFLEKEKVFSRN